MTNPLLTPFDRDGLLATRNRTVMSAMTRGFADAAINHQILWALGDFWIQIILDHAKCGFTEP